MDIMTQAFLTQETPWLVSLKSTTLTSYFIFCITSDLSAFHFAERQMAPLSSALPRVVLPRDEFSLNLVEAVKKINADLKRSFEKQGKSCAISRTR